MLRLTGAAGVLLFGPGSMRAPDCTAQEQAGATNQQVSLVEKGWTYGFAWPKPTGDAPPKRAGIMVWTAPDARRIRSMLVIPNNSDSKEFGMHATLRDVAAKHEMAVVFLRAGNFPEIQEILDMVADGTGIAEFRHAPWIPFGKSSRGDFPHNLMWLHPKRTIAGINYHGAVPPWPPQVATKLEGETVLYCNANGENEWAGTWYLHVRPSFLNYRKRTGLLPCLIVARGVGHGDYVDASGSSGWGKKFPGKVHCTDTWDFLALFVDKALTLRVPADKYPTRGPVELLKVDETRGYLLDRFAVEAVFDVPRIALVENADGFASGDTNEPPVSGYAKFEPLKNFSVPEGVPVVKYESGRSPSNWLITDSLKFAMSIDPMVDLGDLARLMPKPGDQVTIDGTAITFAPILPKHVGPNGGISLKTGLKPGGPAGKASLLAYTVLEFPEKKLVKVQAGFTAATRVQLVLNGIQIRHKQVLEIQPGKYPLLFALRIAADWGRVEPKLGDADEGDVAKAVEMQSEYEKGVAEQAKLKAAGLLAPELQVRKYADVPEAERRKMLWLADKELADAWIKFHSIGKK